MKSKTTIIVILVILVLVVGITEYVRVTKMISIQEREEELHRREMRKLFEMATQREISTATRAQLAQAELKRIDSAIDSIDFRIALSDLQNASRVDTDFMDRLSDDPVVREAAHRRSAKRIEENNNRIKENRQRQNEKTELRAIRLKVAKERDGAMTEHGEALADLAYAKKELAKLGVVVK